MAVDTAFFSLLEKLKVEDPCLPSATWESIPSQNVSSSLSSSFPPPNSSFPNTPLSSLSEESLVSLALNALQGGESALISIQKLSATFCSDPADRTHHRIPNVWKRSLSTHALGKILNSIGCFGSLVFLLHKFVDNFVYMGIDQFQNDGDKQEEEHSSYSLVNQAFGVALGKILEGYVSALNTICASATLRKSSKVDVECYEETCLTSIVHSNVTLLEVYLHTKELRSQIEALGNLCNLYNISLCFSMSSLEELTAKAVLEFCNFYRGGDLLTYIYTELQVADPAHCTMLKFLFLRSCEPYCGFIRSWIFSAETSDPYKEFVIECGDGLQPHLLCKAGIPFDFPLASIRSGVAVPCFLKDFLIPIVRAGQQLQVLMKLLELCNFSGLGEDTYDDYLPSFRGYASEHLFHASSLIFSKGNLEAMITARNTYYKNMLEKLGNLLTKLEFRYQQVVPDDALPIYLDVIGGGSNNEISFALVDGLDISLPSDKWNSYLATDNADSNCLSTGDELYEACELSECSSLSDSEEQNEAMPLTENPNSLDGHDQKYFSSLRFSFSSPITNTLQKSTQNESLYHMDVNLRGNCPKNDLGHFSESYCKKVSPSETFVLPRLGDSNLSCTDRLSDKSWQLGVLSSPFYDNGRSTFYSGPLYNTALAVNGAGMASINKQEPTQTSGKDHFENGSSNANPFTLHQGNDNSSKFLHRNPMLRKNMFFNPKTESGKNSAYGRSLPCFDFSMVENPCRVYVENLAANLRHELVNDGDSSNTAHKSHKKCKQDNDDAYVLVNSSKTAHPCWPLSIKKQGREAIISSDVCGGKTWESLLGKFGFADKERVEEHKDSLSAIFEIPLDFIIDKCVLQEILLQYNYVSKLAIKLLEGFDLHEHFLALRRYYLMELADWADIFIMSLWCHKWGATVADQRVSEIQGFLELSVQRSSCETDPNKDRLYVFIKENAIMPLATSAIGVHSFDFLGLGYRVDWPVKIILTPGALRIYSNIFSFLIQVKLAVFALCDIWRLLKNLMQLSNVSRSAANGREVGQLNLLIKMRQQVNHFVSTLQQYLQSQLSHISWCRFLHNLKYKVKDMMDLELVHMEYLTGLLHICFLSDETRPIANIIESVLQCALDFRACLTTSMCDVVVDEGSILGKLSRINMSQVFAIKQKFDKNLKDLHLCYLKSPKHGEFGLSCFWSHLNYNEFYKDNEMFIYSF